MTETDLNYDPREEKLPQYAQAKLRRLRMRLAEAERQAETARLATDPNGSPVILNPDGHTIGLPEADVRFRVPGGTDHQYADVAYRSAIGRQPAYIEVRTGASLHVLPQASNVIYIPLLPHR